MFSFSKLPNSLPDEKVVLVTRKSLIIFLKEVIFSLVIFVAPAVLLLVYLYAYPSLLSGNLSWPLIVLGGSAYVMFVWVFFFFSFLDYYLDVWIITNRRIIDINQNGFFSRTVSEQNIEKIQDVSSEIKGALHTILNYGDLYVQTAGEVERVSFRDVPDPDGVRHTIMELVEKYRKEHQI